MTAEVVGARTFDIGRVLGESVAVTRRNIAAFGVLTILLGMLPGLLLGLLSLSLDAGQSFSSGENLAVTLIGFILQSAIMYGVVTEHAGRKVTLGQCLAQGSRLFLPMFGLGLLAGLGFLIGLALFIVPGLLLATAWAVAGPARVAEGPGVIKALQRSQALTKGHRWRVFGLFLLVWGGVLLFALIIGAGLAFGGLIQETRTASDVIFEALLTGPATAFPAVVSAVAYLELRGLREGHGSGSLAEVFA